MFFWGISRLFWSHGLYAVRMWVGSRLFVFTFFFFFFSLSHFHRICPDICVSYSFIILRQYLFYSLQCFFFGSLLEAVLVEISALRSLDVTSLCQPQFLMKFLSRQLHGSAVEVAYTADVLSVRKASVLLRWPPAGIGMHETKYGR